MPLGKVVGLGPGHIVRWGPSGDPAPTAAPPHFRPMPIVAKRSPISATAELLLRYLIKMFKFNSPFRAYFSDEVFVVGCSKNVWCLVVKV